MTERRSRDNPAVLIEEMTLDDSEAVRAIYQEGIATGNATFETDAPDWDAWDKGRLKDARLVAWDSGRVVGWAALSPVSSRPVYAGVAEVSLYVATSARGQGVGMSLMTALIGASERAGVWTVQGAIFPENAASLALVKRCGFREVGRKERIGCMNGVWRGYDPGRAP
jgi:phosphinothricin acetyltransferase